ncbi:inorganic phosphate transporter [Candidatus Woesearchaeota archaeon]|nr:inorganic phosphate transporter [Candidatus Woesearchaeota archaeon]
MLDFFVVLVIITALAFDFGNGFNDAANSVSTIVATRVLSPLMAVMMAGLLNIAGAFFFEPHVAATIGKGIVQSSLVNPAIIFAGLLGAIFWVYFCTYYGLPISGSHSLIGGLIGAVFFVEGSRALVLNGIGKVALFIFLAPLLGVILAKGIAFTVLYCCMDVPPGRLRSSFWWGQLCSSALYSLSHGVNDAQKTMGIIALLLFQTGYLGQTFYVPLWVILVAHITIGLGTIAGGWKVIKTMGMKLTHLAPVDGFCAEIGGSAVLFGTAMAGIPVSTTHVIAGSIVGVGSLRRTSAVRWGIVRSIVWAWIITIPCAAFVGGLFSFIFANL